MPIKKWLVEDHPDFHRLMILSRHEFTAAKAHLLGSLSISQRRRRKKLQKSRKLRLQIGAGSNVAEGWISVDIVSGVDLRLDLRRGLPLTKNSVQYIYSEHFLDHLHYPWGVHRVLKECQRVLEPGGVIRVVVHDAMKYFAAYVQNDNQYFQNLRDIGANPHETRMEFLNHIFRFNGLHQFIYDFETLRSVFLRAGFSDARLSSINASVHPELNLDQCSPDRNPQSLYAEAVK
ncbi:MAG: methyltransferase domain-containing protein [Pirellula sp.]